MRRRVNPTQSFNLRVSGTGSVNGVSFEATGAGRGDSRSGELAFEVSFSDVPRGTDPLVNLLGVLIIPTVLGREEDGAVNLMTLAGGDFEFTQVLSGEGVDISSVGRMTRSADDELVWTSEAEGTADLAGVTAIEPFEAVMVPQGPGRFVDVLRIPLVVRGRPRHVHAVRQFTFSPGAELPQLQLREITVDPAQDGKAVSVSIRSTIRPFTSTAARADGP